MLQGLVLVLPTDLLADLLTICLGHTRPQDCYPFVAALGLQGTAPGHQD